MPKKAAQPHGRTAAQKKAAPKAGGKLRVTQVRSKSGRPALHKRTLIALGLRHHQQVIEINDSPAVRGMLHQVRHLVEVAPAGEK